MGKSGSAIYKLDWRFPTQSGITGVLAGRSKADVGYRLPNAISKACIAATALGRKGKGTLIDPQSEGFDAAFERTQELLQSAQPIFEAGFRAEGARSIANVIRPVRKGGKLRRHMVEDKSSASVKDQYHSSQPARKLEH